MKGDIFLDDVKWLKIENVLVKEISYWKFLLIFSSPEECNIFDWILLKDWIGNIRNPCEEDLVIKRKNIVEVRGLPLHL